jgi:Uma2 family endonuclease
MSDYAPAHREYWTLEEFASHFGPVEIQRVMSKAEFVALAEQNPTLRMEREPDGTVTLMSPVKKGSSRRESGLHGLLFIWNMQHSNGEVYGPNGSYDLPNGATKMPDVSWISPERLAGQPDDEEDYIKVMPDFVAEIRSASDNIARLQKKMTDTWMANGVRLGWLIDPYEEKVYLYRAGAPAPEVISGFSGRHLSGESVMPGFSLPLDTMQRKG